MIFSGDNGFLNFSHPNQILNIINGRILGILIAFLFVLTTSLYIQNKLKPQQEGFRIKMHCKLGGLTFFSVILLVFIRIIDGYELTSLGFYSLGFLFIIVASGIVLNYFQDAGSIRYHSRTLHPSLVFALILSVVFYIISKLSLFSR